MIAVGLIDNFLGPKLIGRGIRLHPLLILLSVLGGLAYFGPIGLFLGPLTVSLLFTLLSIYTESSKQNN
jgi:predicted PurR-regulated permease PerM